MRNTTPIRDSVKRKKAFKKALIDEGLTVSAFAKRVGVNRMHIARAFSRPELVSQRVHSLIDEFIAKHATSGRAA